MACRSGNAPKKEAAGVKAASNAGLREARQARTSPRSKQRLPTEETIPLGFRAAVNNPEALTLRRPGIHPCVVFFNTKKIAPDSESIIGPPKQRFRDSKAAGRSERQRLCLRPPIPAASSTHPLPTRTPSPTHKAYRLSVPAKVAKPTRLPHGNFTNCNGISRLVMRPLRIDPQSSAVQK